MGKDNCVLERIKDMFFYDLEELFLNINYIKDKYAQLSKDFKEIYKWYYHCKLSLLPDYKNNPIKSIFWAYINDLVVYEEVELSYNVFLYYTKEKKSKKRSVIQ